MESSYTCFHEGFAHTYIVRAANVNDKVLVNPLMKRTSKLLKSYNKRISHFIADSQYYSEEVFKLLRVMKLNRSSRHSSKVKEPLINLYVTKRFK